MAKAKRNVKNAYNTPFATRLRFLLEKEKVNQNMLAKELSISRQAVNNYTLGLTVPNIDTLKVLAEYFNVSSDYLLGLSDEPTNDKDIAAICDYLGLEEQSLKNINIKKQIMISTNRPVEFITSSIVSMHENLYYDEIYKDVINKFLQSNCILDIITNCVYEVLLEHAIEYLRALYAKETISLDVNEKDKLILAYLIAEKSKERHNLNLFEMEESVKDFAKSLTKIQTMNMYEIEDIIDRVYAKYHEIIENGYSKANSGEEGNADYANDSKT